MARESGRAERRLQETDYLLGVHDEQRSEALRFKEPEGVQVPFKLMAVYPPIFSNSTGAFDLSMFAVLVVAFLPLLPVLGPCAPETSFSCRFADVVDP
jgi:hypothetical protein